MIFRTPISGSTAREIAHEMIGEGEKDYTIKIGDTVLSVGNPGGVLGENIMQLICDLRREVADAIDAVRPMAHQGNDDDDELQDQIDDLERENSRLESEVYELEEACGRIKK